MKQNIFVLPTSGESRLYEFGGQFVLTENPTEAFRNKHIYITNSEDIKEGDWMIRKNENPIKLTKDFWWDFQEPYHKIILSTDPKLIADGVQNIDDDFLNWFVNNSSCDYVEAEREKVIGYTEDRQRTFYGKYKIILPKETPKQESIEEAFEKYANQKWEGDFPIKVEEAAEKYAKESFIPKKNAYGDNVMQRVGQNPMGWSKHCKSARKHFKAGANWMSKTMYSEEELKELAFNFYYDMSRQMGVSEHQISENRINVDVWFEQHKKK